MKLMIAAHVKELDRNLEHPSCISLPRKDAFGERSYDLPLLGDLKKES